MALASVPKVAFVGGRPGERADAETPHTDTARALLGH
jgi:hypothetical protein